MEALWERLSSMVDSTSGAEVKEARGDVTVRLPSGPGLYSFVALEREPGSIFNAMWRLSVETLVAAETPSTDESAEFLQRANASAFGGSWQRFSNGDVGVVGSFLVHESSAPSLAELLPQFLALQVQDALAVGRPPTGRPFSDAHGEPSVAQQVWEREVPLEQLVDLLSWRSSHHRAQRFPVCALYEDGAQLLVPPFVGDAVRGSSGDLLESLLQLTIARTTHPRRGMGTLIQVPLAASVQDDAGVHTVSPWAHNLGRWHGTALGSLLEWPSEDGETQVVYRAFAPDALVSVLAPKTALDRLVDIALGVVNCAGAAGIAIASMEAGKGPEEVEPPFRRDQRVAQLRASVPVRPRPDGLVDLDGAVVESGYALLDRLASDQLQIDTAAHAITREGFTWLPTPFTQRVTATPVQASRGHEVSVVRLATRLGETEHTATDTDAVARRCVELASDAAMASLVLNDDGTVDLTSTIVLHEGVWWHRSSMIAVIAATHTNLAGPLSEALAATGLRSSRHEGFEELEITADDAIVDVVPELLEAQRGRIPEPDMLVHEAIQAMLTREGARQLEGESAPDAVLPLRVLSPAGGFDPVLGEVAVFFGAIDHPQAGPSIRVMVHPGFPVPLDEDQLPALAARLTTEAHAHPVGAFTPAWESSGRTLVATMTVPCLTLAQLSQGNVTALQQADLLLHTVDASVAAVADAVERHPTVFPNFDRSQLHLRDGQGTPHVDHLDGFALWSLGTNVRCLAVRLEASVPERWLTTPLPLAGTDALAVWLTTGPHDRFDMEGTQLVAEALSDHGVNLRLPHGVERFIPPDDLPTFASMLRYAEAPAVGTSEGPIILTPLDLWGDDDAINLLLPPTPPVAAVFSRDLSYEGVAATTQDALWLRFRSSAGTVHVELMTSLITSMLQMVEGADSVPVEIGFPAVDPRVVSTPTPAPSRIELSTSRLQEALDLLARLEPPGTIVSSSTRGPVRSCRCRPVRPSPRT